MADALPIYTYGDGRPVEGRPEPLGDGATTEDRIAYIRARNAYADRVADLSNVAFVDHFKKTIKAAQERD